MFIFHKYLIVKQHFENQDKFLACTACVFLASKSCNSLIFLDKLLKILCEIVNLEDDQFNIESREKVVSFEFEILSSINFDLNIELPYKYLLQMRSYFDSNFKSHSKKIFEVCCFFINDSFTLPACVYYHPLLIALSSIYLLNLKMGINLKDCENGEKWYHLIDQTVDFNQIEKLSRVLMKIYNSNFTKIKNKQNCEKTVERNIALKAKRQREDATNTVYPSKMSKNKEIVC